MFGLRIRGFSTFLYYFPFIISLVVFLVLLYWFKEFIDKKFSPAHKKTLAGLSFLSILFLVISRLLLDTEYNNYPNFLYEHFGITVSQLEFMSFIAALELLVFVSVLVYGLTFRMNRVGRWKDQTLNTPKLEKASFFLAIAGFSGLLILSAYTFLNWTLLSGEEKGGYETRIGRHYQYLVLLKEHTPIDAQIILPPQGDKWPAIGNQPVARYFLYPRILISGGLLNNQAFAETIKDAYFIEIDPLLVTTHWPIIEDVEKKLIFDEKTEIIYENLETVYESNEGKVYRAFF